MKTTADILAQLNLDVPEQTPFHLTVGHVGVTVLCPEPLCTALKTYFADTLSREPGEIRVHLLQGQGLSSEPAWVDWQREQGKSGRKDSVYDLADGRLIKKIRSGVTFLQAVDVAVAFGPLDAHESTVINFINTQVLNACLREDWQLAHAAAVTDGARTLAISGLSGGGKSTSILRMMDLHDTLFVSNDRVLIKAGQPARALGIPKHPRINPGTILGNPRLHGMLTAARTAELKTMRLADLWELEDKYDLIIPQIYGPERMRFDGPLTDFWVLNWSHDSQEPTKVQQVYLAERMDLLTAIMKSPGPFFQRRDGSFEPNGNLANPAPYLEALQDVRVCEVSGRIDFDALAAQGKVLFDG